MQTKEKPAGQNYLQLQRVQYPDKGTQESGLNLTLTSSHYQNIIQITGRQNNILLHRTTQSQANTGPIRLRKQDKKNNTNPKTLCFTLAN